MSEDKQDNYFSVGGGVNTLLSICRSTTFTFFGNDGRMLLTLKSDGTIEKGPAFTTDDQAAIEFLDAVARAFPTWREKFGNKQDI